MVKKKIYIKKDIFRLFQKKRTQVYKQIQKMCTFLYASVASIS